jgi:hypothetical protein
MEDEFLGTLANRSQAVEEATNLLVVRSETNQSDTANISGARRSLSVNGNRLTRR